MSQAAPQASQPFFNQHRQNADNSRATEIIPDQNKTNCDVPTWAHIVQKDLNDNQQGPSPKGWKQRLHLLSGVAGGTGASGSFAADVDIVAYNVAKNINSLDLKYWLSQNGITVKNCTLLTTSEDARSLTYKITIDPKDYEKATTDASIWPYQVGVRLFKQFNTAARNDNNKQRQDNSFNGNYEQRGRNDGFRTTGANNERKYGYQGNTYGQRDNEFRQHRQNRY